MQLAKNLFTAIVTHIKFTVSVLWPRNHRFQTYIRCPGTGFVNDRWQLFNILHYALGAGFVNDRWQWFNIIHYALGAGFVNDRWQWFNILHYALGAGFVNDRWQWFNIRHYALGAGFVNDRWQWFNIILLHLQQLLTILSRADVRKIIKLRNGFSIARGIDMIEKMHVICKIIDPKFISISLSLDQKKLWGPVQSVASLLVMFLCCY